MAKLSSRMQTLIERLDALGNQTTLAAIARALEEVSLTVEDIGEFIRPHHLQYHRARVQLRANYELLVMTWLPRQTSVPHDHTGSVCAMQVVQGEAVEVDHSIASDGFVDAEYEAHVRLGEVSAGQDAGIHTIRNPSATETLVTVHVYAPPLKDVRRFIARPTPRPPAVQSNQPAVVVVGGGFSGAMTAAQILKADSDLRVVLVERRGALGEGLAYSTRESSHLLNVPAVRMSAWPDRPEDFLDWARTRDADVKPYDFLPRQWYSDYLRETLHGDRGVCARNLHVKLDEVRRVARHPSGGWMVHLGQGKSMRAKVVVLAIGHRPPSDPLRHLWEGPRDRYLCDPWQTFAVTSIPGDAPVGILGSGLTAIDAVLSLADQPRKAPITLISRSGLLPHAHAGRPVAAADLASWVEQLLTGKGTARAAAFARAIHRCAREELARQGDWRAVIDGLRPHTARLWQRLPATERQRFLSRLRPYWEVHRHRMAPKIAERLARLQSEGAVRVVVGQVAGVAATSNGVFLSVRPRGSAVPVAHEFGWAINCTGPAPSNNAEANPVIGSLLVHGWVRQDELALGLDTTPEGNAIAANGEIVPDLFVVGTLRKPELWESTAVPELRLQAASVAKQVSSLFPVDSPI